MRWAIAVLALAPLARGDDAFDRRIAAMERGAARELAEIADLAERARCPATADAVRRRAHRLAPALVDPPKRGEAEDDAGEWPGRLREKADAVESRLAEKIVRACKVATDDRAARRHLLRVLDRDPLNAAVHEALGHAKVGERYVRPEFLEAVERMKALRVEWDRIARRDYDVLVAGRRTKLPSGGRAPVVVADGIDFASTTLSLEETQEFARRAAAAHAFFATFWPEDMPVWRRPQVFSIRPEEGARIVLRFHTDPVERRALLRTVSYSRDKSFWATWVHALPDVVDCYAHCFAYRTLQRHVDRQEWAREGYAYILTLELLDTAGTWFFDGDASNAKAEFPPDERNRASCLAYVRDALLAGDAHPLEEVFARAINDLDLLRSLQAWSFLRFLLFTDPEGFRRFPRALAAETEGPYPARADRALAAAFGKERAELERSWRAFMLEITPP